MNFVIFLSALTSHHASGTPRSREMQAASTEVQIDNHTEVSEPLALKLVKNDDHGTLAINAKIGREIKQIVT
jgi:hypothetical protein